MRQVKEITILDGEDQYNFRLTQISAIKAEKWLIRVGIALAKAGLLDVDTEKFAVSSDKVLGAISNLILQKGFGFLGQLDPDIVDQLMFDLVKNTAERVVDKCITKITEKELEVFTDVRALWQLQKEVFAVNFSSYKNENNLKKQV